MKVIGIGLNKTGTKTLGVFLKHVGLRHHSFSVKYFNDYQSGNLDSIFSCIREYDSFEDWPWLLLYKEIDEEFDDCKFILTTRKTPEIWFRSLCNMAVRIGPFDKIERHVYGYRMPQGKMEEHIAFYNKHNEDVKAYFKDKPGKLLEICWENGDDYKKVADFLGLPLTTIPEVKKNNKSMSVYSGNNLFYAKLYQFLFQLRYRKYIRAFKKQHDL